MNTKKRSLHTSLLILSVIALFPISAFAHVVVGATTGFGAGFSHPFSGFDHLLAMIAVGLWAAQLRGRAIWAVPGAFVTLMVFGGILAVSGTRLPYVEAGILASIMVLGIMIAAAFRFPVLVNVFIVGIFAVFHGHAHGTEMPLAFTACGRNSGWNDAAKAEYRKNSSVCWCSYRSEWCLSGIFLKPSGDLTITSP
jgi:urease accessory protein